MLKPPVDQYSAQGGNKLSRLRVYVLSVSCCGLYPAQGQKMKMQHFAHLFFGNMDDLLPIYFEFYHLIMIIYRGGSYEK